MTVAIAKWTLNDYHAMIESGVLRDRRVELVAGTIVEMPPEGPLHASQTRKIGRYLRQLLGDRAAVHEAYPITLPHDGEPEPDIAVVRDRDYADAHPFPEDIFWLIEISKSTVRFDLGAKANAYSRDLIREYWAIDLDKRQLWIHRRPIADLAHYASVEMMTVGTIHPLIFPDLEISIDRLLN